MSPGVLDTAEVPSQSFLLFYLFIHLHFWVGDWFGWTRYLNFFFFTYVIWALLSTHPMVFAHSSTQTDQVCQSKTSNLNGYKEKGACEHMKYPSFPLRHVLSYLFLCVCVFFLPIFLNTLYIPFSLLRKVYPLVWLLQNYPSQEGMKEVGFVNTQDCQKNALNVAQNLLGSKYLIFLGYYCVRSQSLCTASMTQQ